MEIVKLIKYIVSCILLASSVQCTVRKRHAEPNHIETSSLVDRRLIATWGSWFTVGTCSVSCGGQGFIQRERNCSTGIRQDCLNVGEDHYKVDVCNEPCVTGPTTWLEWTCSSSCDGGGFQQVNRECSTGHNADCEKQGGNSWSVSLCHQKPCIPTWSEWGPLSTCPKTCDTGVAIRKRNCSSGNSSDCIGQNFELQPCKLVDCIITTTTITPKTTKTPPSWSAWHSEVACSTSCGPGFGERTRNCSSGNNNDCLGSYFDVTVCNKKSCDVVDGIWTSWSDWETCSVTCAGGYSYRTRACLYPDTSLKGQPCSGFSAETKDCNINLCPVDGVWTSWTAWSDCSKSCDGGNQTRVRGCVFSPTTPHGLNCSGDAKETQPCQSAVCSVDGSWAEWSDWSKCTKTCGSEAIRFRARICMFDFDRPHGADCPGDVIERETCKLNNCIADGSWNEWSTWSQCSHTCEGGKRSRGRVCLYTPGSDRGLPCPGGTLEIQDCGARECPVDGIWSAWYPWSQCTVTCGTGRAVRNRTCTFHTRYTDTPHGEECHGDQAQANDCNTDLCPVDARWSTWSAFSKCSQTCGGGQRTQTRQCIYDRVAPMGLDCTGQSTVTEECSTNECPIDGVIQPWNSWTYCSASCGGGVHTRTRDCYFPTNRPHGDDCSEPINETAPCNVQSCPTTTTTPPTTTLPTADGHWSNWTSWTVCTLTCGGGQQYRERQCTYPDHTLHGQYCPGPQNQTQECNTRLCPVDGIWTQWSAYSKCSVSCAVGFQTRTRQCQFDPKYDRGNNCTGNDTATQSCNNGPCPVDGVFENWSTWSACPVTCGGGIQDRTRVCHFPTGVPHGLDCLGVTHENQTCGNSDCPVDGVFTEWSLWADCTVTCGPGWRLKNRTCYFPPDKPRGHDCVGNLNFTKACANHACPVDGNWNDWAQWAKCSVTCGGGTQQRTRRCHYESHHHHGTPCPGPDTETTDCSLNHCPIDGIWHTWTSWTSCSVTCSNGTKSRDRECYFVPNEPTGNNCSGSANETLDCNLGLCPVDGVWHSWSAWSTCTVTCGNGTSSRDRVCDFQANTPHGRNCTGSNSDARSCNALLCPVDGNYTDWGSWSACSETCGGGSQGRNRSCVYDPVAPRGNNCSLLGASSQTQACMTENCPLDGIWSTWSNYTECTVTCGGGTRARLRKCDYATGFPQGNPCTGPNNETQQCKNDLCPVDGKLSAWGNWEACSKSCANGTQSRHRTCDYTPPSAPHGKPCSDSLDETKRCHTEKCPIAGHWSDWTNFTMCTLTCAGGTHTRNRTCIFDDPEAPHLSECFGNTTDTQDCNTQPCPVDGLWSPWSLWSACDVTCGGGTQSRTRNCTYPPDTVKGKNCTGGPDHENQPCSTSICTTTTTTTTTTLPTTTTTKATTTTSTTTTTTTTPAPTTSTTTVPVTTTTKAPSTTASTTPPPATPSTTPAPPPTSPTAPPMPVATTTTTTNTTTTTPTTTTTTPVTTSTSAPPTTTTPTTTPASATTTAGEIQTGRKCHVCQGPPEICEQLHVLQDCPADKQYCINELTNNNDASRTVIRRCGTYTDCNDEWYLKYSDDDKCTAFSEKLVYTQVFNCLYCCNEDGCNNEINPPNTWTPPDN